MDYLQGGTLQDKLAENGSGLPQAEVRKYFKDLVSALYYCHEVKCLSHRDIKPENMMLDEDDKLILCDFGVSQFFEADNDIIRGAFGTVRFMAPEVLGVKQNSLYAP